MTRTWPSAWAAVAMAAASGALLRSAEEACCASTDCTHRASANRAATTASAERESEPRHLAVGAQSTFELTKDAPRMAAVDCILEPNHNCEDTSYCGERSLKATGG